VVVMVWKIGHTSINSTSVYHD